jgi:hypothetical protein
MGCAHPLKLLEPVLGLTLHPTARPTFDSRIQRAKIELTYFSGT